VVGCEKGNDPENDVQRGKERTVILRSCGHRGGGSLQALGTRANRASTVEGGARQDSIKRPFRIISIRKDYTSLAIGKRGEEEGSGTCYTCEGKRTVAHLSTGKGGFTWLPAKRGSVSLRAERERKLGFRKKQSRSEEKGIFDHSQMKRGHAQLYSGKKKGKYFKARREWRGGTGRRCGLRGRREKEIGRPGEIKDGVRTRFWAK